MIRLNINVPPHAVGHVLSPEEVAALGDTFVQELIASDQATRLAEDASTDPVDLVLGEVFELEDQIDAALGRRARIETLAEGLADDERERVQLALSSASRVRPELFGLSDLPTTDEVDGLKADLSQAQVLLEERSDRIAELETQALAHAGTIESLTQALDEARASAKNTQPPPAEASGDAGEVSASPADPTAPAPVKPAAKSGGTARAKAGS